MDPFCLFVLKTVSELLRLVRKWIGPSDLPDTVRHSVWYNMTWYPTPTVGDDIRICRVRGPVAVQVLYITHHIHVVTAPYTGTLPRPSGY